jgi:hypothetical protein
LHFIGDFIDNETPIASGTGTQQLENTSWKALQNDKNASSDETSDRKRARFRNLIQMIRLTSTILNKGDGPKLHSDELIPNPYESSNYTYLDAAARLLVRKDEVIAAVECTSFRRDDPGVPVEFAVVAQPNNVTVPVVGLFTICCGLLIRKISQRRWNEPNPHSPRQLTKSGTLIPRVNYWEHT